MSTHTKRVRARVRGRHLELLDDVRLPADEEVTIEIAFGAQDRATVLRVLDETAGAWSDEAHDDLRSREDVIRYVRELRANFERPAYGHV